MQWKSSTQRYGGVAIAIHWATAAAILGLLVSGFRAAGMVDEIARVVLLRTHVAFGVCVLALTLLRVGWWAILDRKPADPAGTPRWQARAARLVHVLFYLVIFAMALSGIALVAASGAGPILFGGAAQPLPDFTAYAPRIPHGIGARLLVGLVLVHAGAALYHRLVLRDRVLGRMGLGRRSVDNGSVQK